MTTLLLVLTIALGTSFLCSILEAVFLSLTHSHIALMEERGDRAGLMLARMRANVDEPIAAILTLNTIAHTVGASMGGAMAYDVFGERWVALFSALLTLAILVLSEIVPKTLGATWWRELSRPTAHILRVLIVLMKPVLIPLAALNRLISPRDAKRPTISRAELGILAEIGRREGTLGPEEWEVVTNIITLGEVKVTEAMTPRTDVVAIAVDATLADAKRVMVDSGHSRLPVFEASIDDVVGVLVSRDLQEAELRGVGGIRQVMRPPRFVPASKSVEELLREMRRERVKLAVVIDEFGGTAGIVTLEDLLEEIVGDIQDEYDEDQPEFVHVADDTWIVGGWVSLRDVSERLRLDLPVDDYTTLGGFLFGELARVGAPGDIVAHDDVRFRIESMNGLRVDRVLVELPRRLEEDDEAGDEG